MDKKIIFFDIDGTLLDHDKKLPASTKKSVQKLKEQGHEVAIATGRAPFVFENICKELQINTYVGLNGQYVVHDNEIIYKNPINLDQLNILQEYSQAKAHPLLFINDKEWNVTMDNHPHVEEAIGSLKMGEQFTRNVADHSLSERFQAMLFCQQGEETYYKNEFPAFNFVRWHDYSVDVLPKGSSKAVGIEKLLEALTLEKSNAYAFGDGLNDREMLSFIPNSVAMGNAVDAVKSSAKYVTKDVDDDGIFYGLKKLGLI